MEGSNWHPRERNFNNRRGQQSFTRPYPHNNRSHPYNSYRNTPAAYSDEGPNYSKRENCDSEGECFRTNVYKRRRLPYDKNKGNCSRNMTNRDSFGSQRQVQDSLPSTSSQSYVSDDLSLMPPQEAKAINLINAARAQTGICGQMVFLQTGTDNSFVIIQNSVQTVKNAVLSVSPGKELESFELKINGECFAKGEFPNKQVAKTGLCEIALNELKKRCFLIIKKKNYEEISTEDINKAQTNEPTSSNMEGSKAHLMMLKMGWGGKGLGVNEQGAEKTVAETMTRNITKEGLGGRNIMEEINNILKEFARSAKVTTLAFDSSFTKEERARIHSLASHLNLKSKSEGQGEHRRITIGKKIARWDLVKELLIANCENESYKLIIPSKFEHLWVDEEN